MERSKDYSVLFNSDVPVSLTSMLLFGRGTWGCVLTHVISQLAVTNNEFHNLSFFLRSVGFLSIHKQAISWL